MKVFLGIATMATAAVLLGGCAREDDSVSGSAPSSERGSSANNVNAVPRATAPLTAGTTTNAGPDTGVGAATAASSGVGTATASGSTAVESKANATPDQNQSAPAGTGAENPTVNSNGVGNAGSSTPQNNGSNR